MPKQKLASKKSKKATPHKKPATKTAAVITAQPMSEPIPARKLNNAWALTKSSATLLWQHRRLFLTITLIYGLLTLVLVRGLAGGTNVSELKNQLSDAFTGNLGALASGFSIFVVLVGSSGNNTSETAGVYQLFLTIITTLAVVWALRQVMAGKLVRARDAFYSGMYPLVPFIIVLLVVCLQLIPLIIGATLYTTVVTNGIAVHFIEQIMWGMLFAAFAAASLYMLSSSLLALYIVALPDMPPLKALRSARDLVKKRRFAVIRKILFLPIALIVLLAAIMVPIIIIVTPLAQWVFFILSMFSLVAIHAYMYTLYRELLDE